MFLVIVGPHDSHHAVLSLSRCFFFLSFCPLPSWVFSLFSVSRPSTSLCHPSFPPHARFLAPLPPVFFFPLVLRDANDRWLSGWCAVFGGGGSRLCFTYNSLVFSVWPHRHCQFRPCRGIVFDFRIVTVLLALPLSLRRSDERNLIYLLKATPYFGTCQKFVEEKAALTTRAHCVISSGQSGD